MSEQSEQDPPNNTPWLAIAAIVVVLGVIVTVSLGSVEPPPPPPDPSTVLHTQADLSDWDPFADSGAPTDAGTDMREGD